MPDRPAALCRELTKTYEEVRRGSLADLVAMAEAELRGEVTSGGGRCHRAGRGRGPTRYWPPRSSSWSRAGAVPRDAVDAVAARYGIARRVVYPRRRHPGGAETRAPNPSPRTNWGFQPASPAAKPSTIRR